ncbi:MAG: hypothetical protein K9H84_05395 [Bacteroidales bacterium]|nr:hypothetical protein [Bacteroidales bacterium]
MKIFKQHNFTVILSFFSLITYILLILFSKGSYGGADELKQFKYAYNAFQNPELQAFLQGKQFYVLLTTPFAYFGLIGLRLFNVALAVITGYLTYRSARLLGYQYAVLAPVLVLFAPIYAIMVPTAMTEILFSFILILSIWLFLKNKFLWSSLILSFIPFIRNEGIVILFVFALAFLILKNYKSIPYLLTGFVLYGITGAFVFNDPLWILHQVPYGDASNIYGTGSILRFCIHIDKIFGFILTTLILIGLIRFFWQLTGSRSSTDQKTKVAEGLVITGSFLGYFAVHSFVWYAGISGSLGLLRVMAAIVPAAALLGIKGLDSFRILIEIKPWIKYLAFFIFIFFYIRLTMNIYTFPVELDREAREIKKAVEWIDKSTHQESIIHYHNAWLEYFFIMAGHKPERLKKRIPNVQYPAKNVIPGSLIIWDAHFSPNEGQLPLDALLNHDAYKLLNIIELEASFKTLGDRPYKIYIFQKKVNKQ